MKAELNTMPWHLYVISVYMDHKLVSAPYSLFLLFVSESSQLLVPLEQEYDLPLISVFVSYSPCLRTEALIPKYTLSVPYHGGRLFWPGSAHKKDCQLPIPFPLASLPGLDSCCNQDMWETYFLWGYFAKDIWSSGPWPWILSKRKDKEIWSNVCWWINTNK